MKERLKSFICLFGFYFITLLPLFSWEYYSPYGYRLDLPDGWEVLSENDPAKTAFTDSDHVCVLQVSLFPGMDHDSARDLCSEVQGNLSASGDSADFIYSGTDAVFADFQFSAGSYPARGYFIFINTDDLDYVVTAFAAAEYYDRKHDFLLSCIDSFSPEGAAITAGPVSVFYDFIPDVDFRTSVFPFAQSSLSWTYSDSGIEGSQLLIEREARILVNYEGNRDAAWQRYYRMIYRDNYQRLQGLSQKLAGYFYKEGTPREEIPELLLAELQNFSYSRTGTLSDTLSPLSAAVEKQGDCDTRGLLYAILLNSMNFDTIILVSSEYSHSLAAVNLDKDGARYTYNGKQYLVAELTDKVAIGMIPQSMADPSKWVPVGFGRAE